MFFSTLKQHLCKRVLANGLWTNKIVITVVTSVVQM